MTPNTPPTPTPTPLPTAEEVADLFAIVRAAEKRLLHFFETDHAQIVGPYGFDQTVITLQRLTAVHKTLIQLQDHLTRDRNLISSPTVTEGHCEHAAADCEASNPSSPQPHSSHGSPDSHNSHNSHSSNPSNPSGLYASDMTLLDPDRHASDMPVLFSNPALLAAEIAAIDAAIPDWNSGDIPIPYLGRLAPLSPLNISSPRVSKGPMAATVDPVSEISQIPTPVVATVSLSAVPGVSSCPRSLKPKLDAAVDFLDQIAAAPRPLTAEEADALWLAGKAHEYITQPRRSLTLIQPNRSTPFSLSPNPPTAPDTS